MTDFEPTMRLRWLTRRAEANPYYSKDIVLQQEWRKVHECLYVPRGETHYDYEWRDVETVGEGNSPFQSTRITGSPSLDRSDDGCKLTLDGSTPADGR